MTREGVTTWPEQAFGTSYNLSEGGVVNKMKYLAEGERQSDVMASDA